MASKFGDRPFDPGPTRARIEAMMGKLSARKVQALARHQIQEQRREDNILARADFIRARRRREKQEAQINAWFDGVARLFGWVPK